MRLRVLISLSIGALSGIYCWFLFSRLHLDAADFSASIFAARAILIHHNPYLAKLQLYPLPAALFGMPFVSAPLEMAGSIFFGLSSAILAFGLTRTGYTRLFIFLAYPYWAALITAQWSPLLMASAFFPLLMPVILAKPQIGLPIALTSLNWKGVWLCIAFLLISFLLMPNWPLQWSTHFKEYKSFIPLVVFPGPLLLLSLYRYRDRDAWLLILASIMPQRWFYDAFTLWLIPKSRREIIWTIFFSWGTGILRWYYRPQNITQAGRWTVIFCFLPMLIVVLARKQTELDDSFSN